MAILVTGGAGYIGSHTCVELLNAGYEVVVVDNYSNSSPDVLSRIEEITGKTVKAYEVDLLDREKLEKVFQENEIDAVLHFAGYKAVGESVANPLMYYHNNVTGTIYLLEIMKKYNTKKMVFSSSATVYGPTDQVPIKETEPLHAINPYGQTKLMIEHILNDLYVSDQSWSIALLRYFNPIGAHESGKIGENPSGIPNNLVPYITQVASGQLEELKVFGNDYPTHDGTGVRDYIHVVDLSLGHIKALEKVLHTNGVEAYNLGTGNGYSVLDLVHTFEKVSGQTVKYTIVERRPGDAAISFADPTKAKEELGWEATRDLEQMLTDSWRWEKNRKNL